MSKRIIWTGAISAAFAVALPLHAAWTAAEGAELFVTGDGTAEHNDNIFLSSTGAKSDSVLDLAPGLLFTFGENAIDSGEVGFKEDFRFYSSNSGLNASLAHGWANFDRNDAKVHTIGGISFQQFDQANIDVRGAGFLVRRDNFHVNGDWEVDVSDKSLVGAGVAYDRTEYKRAGYADWKWWEVPVKYYYKMWPKLELGGGFTYRTNELAGPTADSKEYFYNLRVRGDLTPKLTGEIATGLVQRKPDFGSSSATLGIDSKFTYTATEKTLINFGVTNGFSYSGTAASYRKPTFNLGTDITFSPAFRAGANLSYSRYDYTNTAEKDDFYNFDIHGSYVINAYLSVNGSYTYTRNDSNLAGSGFTQNTFRVGASLKY